LGNTPYKFFGINNMKYKNWDFDVKKKSFSFSTGFLFVKKEKVMCNLVLTFRCDCARSYSDSILGASK